MRGGSVRSVESRASLRPDWELRPLVGSSPLRNRCGSDGRQPRTVLQDLDPIRIHDLRLPLPPPLLPRPRRPPRRQRARSTLERLLSDDSWARLGSVLVDHLDVRSTLLCHRFSRYVSPSLTHKNHADVGRLAMISATFSLVQQLTRLKAMPPVKIIHSSDKIEGQVFVPLVNFLCMLGTIGLSASPSSPPPSNES
jgi:hypothetical protein